MTRVLAIDVKVHVDPRISGSRLALTRSAYFLGGLVIGLIVQAGHWTAWTLGGLLALQVVADAAHYWWAQRLRVEDIRMETEARNITDVVTG